jgi:protein SCO1
MLRALRTLFVRVGLGLCLLAAAGTARAADEARAAEEARTADETRAADTARAGDEARAAEETRADAPTSAAPKLPPVTLTDENGKPVRLYDDLAKGRILVMNFIFTSCSTICQPMSATFARMQSLLGARPVRLVSVTIDPETDTPARLAEWKAKFQGGPAWTLLTGPQPEIDRVRKAVGVYTADRLSHSPMIVVLDDIHRRWTRVNALAPAQDVINAIDELTAAAASAQRLPHPLAIQPAALEQRSPLPPQPQPPQPRRLEIQLAAYAQSQTLSQPQPQPPRSQSQTQPQPRGAGAYFRGLSLVDQTGRHVDLYTDIIKDHIVVINTFFASCQSSCPMIAGKMAALQARFADRLGRELRFVSITVDPDRDTPQRLREYAAEMHAKDGWIFLTGTPDAVAAALKKLGQYAESPDAHSNVMIVGNDATGLWKKMFGLSDTESLGNVVQSVLNDTGAP